MGKIMNNDIPYAGAGGPTILNEQGQPTTYRQKVQYIGADIVDDAANNVTKIYLWSATISINTSSSVLFGKTITISKDGVVVGTTTFSAQGSASYTVHETGTYTCECEGYSGSATVSAETTYNVTINAGLDLASWISAGSTTDYPLNPSSYADFSALEADEAAVRQLMLVHDAVDYLATAGADDALIEDVINSDICAKWINLSGYAYDVLSVSCTGKNLLKKSRKTTVTNNGVTFVFNADGSVTFSGTTPSNANAEVAFDSNDTSLEEMRKISDIGTNLILNGSDSVDSIYCVEAIYRTSGNAYISDERAYNGDLKLTVPANAYYLRVAIMVRAGNTISTPTTVYPMIRKADITDPTYEPYFNAMDTADKYGYGEWGIIDSTTTPPTWGALGNVPIMTANNAPYGEVFASSSWDSNYAAWHAFDGNSSTSWSCGRNDSWGNAYIEYDFVNPVCVKSVRMVTESTTHDVNLVKTYQLKGCNGSTWENVGGVADRGAANVVETNIAVENTKFYSKYRVVLLSGYAIGSVIISKLQFYGRELKPLVPTMTSNTAPKGECIGGNGTGNLFNAFDGNVSTYYAVKDASNSWVGYDFGAATKIKIAYLNSADVNSFKIQQSADKSTWSDVSGTVTTTGNIATKLTDSANARYYKMLPVSTNNWGHVNELQLFGMDYSEKEFAQGSTRKTIYDHGVMLVDMESATSAGTGITGRPATFASDYIKIDIRGGGSDTSCAAISTNSIDLTSYNQLYTKLGIEAGCKFFGVSSSKLWDNTKISYINKNNASTTFADLSPIVTAVDISSVSQSAYIWVGTWSGSNAATANTGFARYDEIWIE